MNKDNQQERLYFYNLGYILGLVDGEGCCTMRRDKKYYSPLITISNTNYEIIRNASEALRQMGIAFYITYRPYNLLRYKEKRPWWRINIQGLKRVLKATDILLQLPSGKKDRLQLLNDFCRFRLSVPQTNKGGTNQWKALYGKTEQDYKDRLIQMNNQYKGSVSSETICEKPQG